MRKNLRSKIYHLLVVTLLMTGCRNDHTAHDHGQYTCPMHPQVVQDKAGACPICGMDLVRKTRPGEEVTMTSRLEHLLKPANSVVTTSIRTVFPVTKSMEMVITARGSIQHDTRKIASISARFAGRIEKLFVSSNLQPITKGQKILEIYSPDLLTAQRDMLYLLDKDPTNAGLISSSKERLSLLGLTDNQIGSIVKSKKEVHSLILFSPVDGYIMEHSTSEAQMAATSGRANDEPTGLKIREGMYVATGETLFEIVSHADLWAEFDVYPKDAPNIKMNEPVRITVDDAQGEVAGSKVSFIQPFIRDGGSFTKIRAYLYNPHHHYHPGQLVSATITALSDTALWIPRDAKLNLGVQDIVFLKRSGVFSVKAISVGREAGEWVEVLGGISATDSLAYNAHFMIDSESFIQVNQNHEHTSNFIPVKSSKPDNASIILSESQIRLGNITTMVSGYQDFGSTTRLSGRLMVNEAERAVISSRAKGRIEKLYLKELGLPVVQGQPLYDLYSEEMLTLQQEYLIALKHRGSALENSSDSFLKSAEKKLLLFGMTRGQIHDLAKHQLAASVVTFLSPSSGVITRIDVADGQYIEEGTALYRIDRMDRLWVEAAIYASEEGLVKIGDKISIVISGFENIPVEGKIIFLSPEYRNGSQVLMLRAVIDNSRHRFIPGLQASVLLDNSGKRAITLPVDAVIHGVKGDHVWIRLHDGAFQPRVVQTGMANPFTIEIIAGLNEKENVVVTGAYLLYGEMVLKRGGDPMMVHH